MNSFRIGCEYSDPAGRGVFFLNHDNTVSWGPGLQNIILSEPEAQAKVLELNAKDQAAGYNKDGKFPWKTWPVISTSSTSGSTPVSSPSVSF